MVDVLNAADVDTHADEVVVLTVCGSEPEAAMIVNALRDCHIQAEMTGALTANFRADVPGFVRILVRGDDLETAREILDEYNEEESGRAIVGDDDDGDEEEWAGASGRRVKVLIGVVIMVVIVVYFAVNSIDMF